MTEENKQVALNADHSVTNLNMGFMVANTLDDAMKIAAIIAKSEICPLKMKDKPGDVMVAMQLGAELGLKPMAAIQNIAVINGRPSVWGDALLAVCRQSPQFEWITETYIKERNGYECIVKRKGNPPITGNFDEVDAKKAALWTKQGPWTQYPKRMLQMRARGFALRDAFPDLLRGIITREEATDYPEEKVINQVPAYHSTVQGEVVDAVNTLSSEQLEMLHLKIEQSKSDEAKVCKSAGVEKLEHLTPTAYAMILGMLNTKISRAAKQAELAALAKNKSDDAGVTDFIAELGEVNVETGEVL